MKQDHDERDRVSILLVEDEYLVAAGIMTLVDKMGFSVCALAASGEEALEQVRHHRPDLILMDVVLRGKLKGTETARRIRRHHQAPIIFMSAHPSDQILDQLDIESVMVLPKPFTSAHLQNALQEALGQLPPPAPAAGGGEN